MSGVVEDAMMRGVTPRKVELWGLDDLARELGISPVTAAQWRRRGKLPEPDWIVSNRPIWNAEKARRWLARREGERS